MDQTICIAIKRDGEQCTHKSKNGDTRCTVHLRTMERNGPHTTQRNELKYIHKKKLQDAFDNNVHMDEYDLMVAATNLEMAELVNRQQDEIRRTGMDPDEEANRLRNERREWRLTQRMDPYEEANRIRNQRREWQLTQRMYRGLAYQGMEEVPQPPPPNADAELQEFSNDNQNVHRKVTVDATMKIIQQIRKISVPAEYAWNTTTCSKTPGEIITSCSLTTKAAIQMMTHYTNPISIYEFEKGIYGRVLDCVWQFIKESDDAPNLHKILKQELEDNVGMCAIGNLTRICNVLSGYIEGIHLQDESQNEKLGNLFSALLADDTLKTSDKLKQAKTILTDMNIPKKEWKVWMEPLKA